MILTSIQHPDGKHMIFSTNDGIFSANIDSGEVTTIVAMKNTIIYKYDMEVRSSQPEHPHPEDYPDTFCWVEFLSIIYHYETGEPRLVCGSYNEVFVIDLNDKPTRIQDHIKQEVIFSHDELVERHAVPEDYGIASDGSHLFITNIHVHSDNRHIIVHTTDNRLRMIDVVRKQLIYTMLIISHMSAPLKPGQSVRSADFTEQGWADWGLRLKSRMTDDKRYLLLETDAVANSYSGFAVVEISQESSPIEVSSGKFDEAGKMDYYINVCEYACESTSPTAASTAASTATLAPLAPLLTPTYYRRFGGHHIECIEVSPDRRWIVLSTCDRSDYSRCEIFLYDFDTGRPVYSMPSTHKDRINTITFTPDSRMLLTTGSDDTLRLFDIEMRKEVAILSDKDEPNEPYVELNLYGDAPMTVPVYSYLEFWNATVMMDSCSVIVWSLVQSRQDAEREHRDTMRMLAEERRRERQSEMPEVEIPQEELYQELEHLGTPVVLYCMRKFDIALFTKQRALLEWRNSMRESKKSEKDVSSGAGSD
jgi:hypothetical protein